MKWSRSYGPPCCDVHVGAVYHAISNWLVIGPDGPQVFLQFIVGCLGVLLRLMLYIRWQLKNYRAWLMFAPLCNSFFHVLVG